LVEYPVVVAIEQAEVFLVFLLFFWRDVLLHFLLCVGLVFVDGSQLSDLPICWYFRQIIHEGHFLSGGLCHRWSYKIQYQHQKGRGDRSEI